MNKVHIILAMHDHLSIDLIQAAKRFMDGVEQQVISIPLTPELTLDEYKQRFEKILQEHEQVLVLTDVLAGACTVALAQCIVKYPFFLVSGTNLSMLLAAIENCNELSGEELAKLVVEVGREDIKLINQLVVGE